MLQDTATIESKYNLFIQKAVATKLVWGLKNKSGWANSNANEDEDVAVIPFWSDRAYAKACARDDWKSYTPTEIPLPEFLESWCVGMAEENVWVGANWDANMLGSETNAPTVLLDILTQLKNIDSTIKFVNYGSIDEFIEEITEDEEE